MEVPHPRCVVKFATNDERGGEHRNQRLEIHSAGQPPRRRRHIGLLHARADYFSGIVACQNIFWNSARTSPSVSISISPRPPPCWRTSSTRIGIYGSGRVSDCRAAA